MSATHERMSRRMLVLVAPAVAFACLVAAWLYLDHPETGDNRSEGSGSLDAGAGAESLPLTITGAAGGLLSPGVMVPLDLSLVNPNRQAISVGELTVSLQLLEAPNVGAAMPCTADDFAVRQFSGPVEFVVPATATTTLSDLAIPSGQWPEVGMHDLPVNQDGCKGASVRLLYSATGKPVGP